MRSNGCGDLREQNIDQQVQLCGWVDRRRDHGGVIFIDLRDRSGTVQITVDPDRAPMPSLSLSICAAKPCCRLRGKCGPGLATP